MSKNLSYKTHPKRIDLTAEEGLATLEILKVLKVKSGSHGNFSITKGMLVEIKENFYNNIHRLTDQDNKPMIPLNFSHDKGKEAAGWIKELEIDDTGTTLIGKIELTPIGREKVTNKEYAFASAELAFELDDPELNQTFKNVLTGAALTNIPFIRGMKSIELTELKEFNMEEILKLINDLTDEEKVILIEKLKSMMTPSETPEINAEGGDKNLSQEEVELSQLKREVKALQDAKVLQTKELQFTKLLAEGKVVPAQKEAYIKNDVDGIIKNASDKNINLNQNSADFYQEDPKDEEIKTKEDAENKVIELASDLQSKDKSLSLAQAYTKVLCENENLQKFINTIEE
jgi:hypothetical protein